MRTRMIQVGIVAVAAAASAALAADSAAPVSQVGRRFSPDRIAIPASAPLAILNDDRFTHHIFYETRGAEFDSGVQRPGQTVRLSFPADGVYHVRCAIHPKMRLTVTVGEPTGEISGAAGSR